MTVAYRVLAARALDPSLLSAWQAIRAGEPAYRSPYFAPELTLAVAAERNDVRVVVIENDGRPIGFFPHQRSRFGIGKPVAGPLSDYHGVVASPDGVWDVAAMMDAAGLAAFTFDHLVDPTGRFSPHVEGRAASPTLELADGFARYLDSLGRPPQDFVRKARKLGRELGPLSFVLHESAEEALAQAIAWKRAQYRRTELMDAFAVPWTRRLLARIMRQQSPGLAGVCSVLRAGDRIVAVHAGMRSGSVLHWWFPTYDPQLRKYSPGMILLFRVAEAMAAAGLSTLDLGKGDEPYKRAVANGAVELCEGFVERPSWVGRLRALRRRAESGLPERGLGGALRLPLRALRRLEWMRRYY